MQPMLPAAIHAAFHFAGVVPIFVQGLNAEAWLSSVATVCGRPLLVIDADVSPERLGELADEMLTLAADRLSPPA